MATQRIRLGPRVTPLPRRRPRKLAREAVSLDHLLEGRLILGVGAGYPANAEAEFARIGEDADPRLRAVKLEEELQVVTGLWTGRPFAYHRAHYHVEETVFLPPPHQSARIPIRLAAFWPNRAPFRRAARWDGVCVG
jgi:alkanesulfonate monooxygenase SsuD/methylene tetrahydromethanopterin reductase-like flavin-dependent oxidoreductase (luciferase family)